LLLTLSILCYSQEDSPIPLNPDDSEQTSVFKDSNKDKLGWRIKGKWYFSFNVLSPNANLYFDLGKDAELNENDEPVEPDFYKDGAASFNLQLISFDFFRGESDNFIRYGFNLGLGVNNNKGNTDEAGYFVTNIGLALTLDQNIRIETGYMLGISAKESYTKIYDDAFYIGITFPIMGSENIKKWAKEETN